MRIEEACGCGARIALEVQLEEERDGVNLATQGRNNVRKREAWDQVDRWRRAHLPCRKREGDWEGDLGSRDRIGPA